MDYTREEWQEKICCLIRKIKNPRTLWRLYNFAARLYGKEP